MNLVLLVQDELFVDFPQFFGLIKTCEQLRVVFAKTFVLFIDFTQLLLHQLSFFVILLSLSVDCSSSCNSRLGGNGTLAHNLLPSDRADLTLSCNLRQRRASHISVNILGSPGFFNVCEGQATGQVLDLLSLTLFVETNLRLDGRIKLPIRSFRVLGFVQIKIV